MKQISLNLCIAISMLAGIVLHSCEKDTIDGPCTGYSPWFPDYEATKGLKIVTVPAEGGEISVMTNIDGAVPLEFMASNVVVAGTDAVRFSFEWNEDSKVTYCDKANLEADDSAFDWCNPRRHILYTHEWLGIWQEPYVLHLYVQPNESTADRTIYVAPHREPVLYGFLTVVQEGATDGNGNGYYVSGVFDLKDCEGNNRELDGVDNPNNNSRYNKFTLLSGKRLLISGL